LYGRVYGSSEEEIPDFDEREIEGYVEPPTLPKRVKKKNRPMASVPLETTMPLPLRRDLRDTDSEETLPAIKYADGSTADDSEHYVDNFLKRYLEVELKEM
jgi:hypothetical protein